MERRRSRFLDVIFLAGVMAVAISLLAHTSHERQRHGVLTAMPDLAALAD